MNKAQKIIILAAATLIVYLILFPPESGFFTIDEKGNLTKDTISFGPEIVEILVIAGVAFVVARKRRPKGKEK